MRRPGVDTSRQVISELSAKGGISQSPGSNSTDDNAKVHATCVPENHENKYVY